MKMDGRLARNSLRGALGDALHALMCGAGHNLRIILAKLRLLCALMGIKLRALLASLSAVGIHVSRRRVRVKTRLSRGAKNDKFLLLKFWESLKTPIS